MDFHAVRTIVTVGLIAFAIFGFSWGTSWVHEEYYRRHAIRRAPRWLYYLEYLRALIGLDATYGRPDPPEPNEE